MKTRNPTISVMVVVLCLTSSQVMGAYWIGDIMFGGVFKDRRTHDIDHRIYGELWVDYQALGMQTTLNLLGDAIIYDLGVCGDSKINISGGMIHWLYGDDSSRIVVSGGTIGGWLHTFSRSQATVSGDEIAGGLYAYESSKIMVSGGLIGRSLNACGSGKVTLEGWNFAVDGQVFGYGELTSILGGQY